RDEEIRRVLQILSRRTKNNPILVGEAGVGKTAIAEGIAHRIVDGDVPENLRSKIIFSLDMGALIAGAKYQGEFEERLKSVVQEVIAGDGEILLFIDEIHTLVGAGKSSGAMDAANILKPALARGDLRTIGATTLDEFQKYFEQDKALERRFQKVMIDEPTTEDAISILRGLKERYESHHQVRIKDEAIVAAVELSHRYITSRFLPDKAIDLVDEAASRLRLEMNSVPEEIDGLERRVRQLEIEREAIRRENDKERIALLDHEIEDLKSKVAQKRAKWQGERDILRKIQENKDSIEQLKIEAQQAERQGDYGRVAEIRYGKIVDAQKQIDALQDELKAATASGHMIKEEVDSQDIAEVVSRWTGIPVTRMLSSEREKLLNMEQELHRRVVGQQQAISVISDAVRRSRAGLNDPRRPIGSFIFLGTTGVGKTELAKALAEFLFNDENMMTRIDMSEYQERHSVSRLVGAPPGYVGYDEGGQLTEAVRRKPYSVVLLDEIEKAHPDVFNILLQVLDDGRLTDNKGRTVDFRNTIIIMTSNMGSSLIQESFSSAALANNGVVSEQIVERTRTDVIELLKQQLKPEFLNRIDEIVMFEPLSESDIRTIVDMQMGAIRKILAHNGISLNYTDAARDWIARTGYDAMFGARPVKRVIQREVVNELSKKILAGDINREKPISIDVAESGLTFSN
ncbi:MAG: AAA family ATPase, partial [Alistipes sp.]|nr:AAA family ATPase [Alistipes sp.]